MSLTDPFLSHEPAVERLWSEYVKHRKLIVAIDFDDTIFDFHSNGTTYPLVLQLLRDCDALGFYLVLFTARMAENVPFALEHMKDLGLTIASVNANPFPLPYGNNGKPYYNILLDDRAGLGCAYGTLRAVVDRITGNSTFLNTSSST